MKYIIVGGVAGGATTAARLRRIDENSEIIMFDRGGHISYANCGLPYYIGGVIKERSSLLVQTPESFGKRFNIDVRIHSNVVSINKETKEVSIHNTLTDEKYIESYDKLILSPGASPIKPPIPGINMEGIFTLRNVEDTDAIKAYVDDIKPRSAVVVGAGFIGLEMAENLQNKGVKVTVVEAASQVMNMMDSEIAAHIHSHFKEKDVALFLNDGVKEFVKKNDMIQIVLASGEKILADFVMLSIGVRPDTELAKEAGLKIGETGGIWVDEYLQTSEKDIYALGDSIEFPHRITGIPVITYLAGPANKQGRLLADNMVFGHKKPYKGAIGTAIAKIFDMTIASTGLSHRQLKQMNIKHLCTIVVAGSHAGYYPGSTQMTIKICFEPDTGKILGGQIVGYDGVAKRIDMLAGVINNGGTIYDLQELEHAYAPPFSSAKDPLNQAGFNAENVLKGFFKPMSPFEFKRRDKENSFILDVRTPDEVMIGAIKGSVNIEVDELRDNLDKIPKDKSIIIYCGMGLRGYVASQILRHNGYKDIYNLNGGLKVYKMTMAKQDNPIHFNIETKAKHEEMVEEPIPNQNPNNIQVDACGLQCPGPILKLKDSIADIEFGAQMTVKATDAGFYNDVASWCKVTGNKLIKRSSEAGVITAIIEKFNNQTKAVSNTQKPSDNDNKTLIVFSDDMDKALASFVIANGAAAMGKQVTMFFTFWGLNVIKKPDSPKVKKDFMGKMFSKMMPKHAGKLHLSNMDMGGVGRHMMKLRMKNKNVDALETMMRTAVEGGVNLIACQMSMDLMSIQKEELIDGVKIGGVANYLEEAEKANVNLFI